MMIDFTPLSPVFLSIGPIKMHYYGLMYVLAFGFAYFFLPVLFRIRRVQITTPQFENIFFYGLLGGIFGGRIFYVLFYNFHYYFSHPFKIFAVWEGGMASHGGIFGAALAVYFVCRLYKIAFFKITDCLVIPTALGLMFGRFGNFINGELYGRITDVSWCVHFKSAEGCRHPSQLYAAAKDISLFTLLFSLRTTQWKDGSLSMIFLSSYLTLRFIVEFFREPDPQIGYLWLKFSQGQWISLLILIGVVGFSTWYFYVNNSSTRK